MDSKIDQGISYNFANIALYQQLLNQKNQAQAISTISHSNYQQGKQFESNSSSSVNNSHLQNASDNITCPVLFNLVPNQQSLIKDNSGMHLLAQIQQQNSSDQPNILQIQQLSQTKNILPSEVPYALIRNNFMQPVLQLQMAQQQPLLLGVQDQLSALPLIQPAQLANTKQDIYNINNLLQKLNIQNEPSNNPQQNLLIFQQPAMLLQSQQQQQQFFQNPQLLAHANLLNTSNNNLIGQTIQSNNEQKINKDLNQISAKMNDQLLLVNNQNQQMNQFQQLNSQLFANQMILPAENQSMYFNKIPLNHLELNQQALISQQLQQQLIMQKNMGANAQILLASSNELMQLQNQESQNQLQNEQNRQNLQNYKSLLPPLKNVNLQDKTIQGITPFQNSEDISSSTTISNSQKGLILNNQYSNTLSPQRASNPSIQSIQQSSSLTHINHGEKTEDCSNIFSTGKVIASLKDIDQNDLTFSHNPQIFLSQKLLPVQMKNDSQNNKIVANQRTSNEIYNSVEDLKYGQNKGFQKQKSTGDREKNGTFNRVLHSSQSSSSSTPLKSKTSKKEEKNLRKQHVKMYQNPLNSEFIQSQLSSCLSDNNSKESKDNKQAKTRNNEDPYKNYGYDSQIKNQLRKQVLKCFFKNVSTYVDKFESQIAHQFPNLEKNALKSLCKYWSQFDNPTKRENLKNDEYKSLCQTLGINSEIKPLGQKSIKEVFCLKNDFSEGLKYLFTSFNEDLSLHSKKQKQKKMKELYIETSEEILDDILGRQRKKKDAQNGQQNKDTN
ncbi:hypothetical protein TTHERM_00294900 (macronuclear) [Tetrahymena thermophila SB210]|uniref:Uncharacterized protein n=1 Tax=Tetrahymena thermophila (strain SB210) TaxID=312017 RepID=I7MDX0_TETTS|nr:hypothetical protein TTHERM_00294900 [Tetrahymena thermophila SB210]EAR92877.2 hypothetical protein TTHERM_00294900 [Tetrahymena thermophila SB210]|eukprot:XP_001013122.2 hypothetical protein TTHERM_00294900 [Tetrahymena thermophila SB210]